MNLIKTYFLFGCLVFMSLLMKGQTAFNFTLDEAYHRETGEAIIQTLDGGFLMTGAYFTTEYKTTVTKINSYGKVKWSKQFDVSEGLTQIGQAVVQLPDSSFVVGIGSDLGDSFLLKIDREGNEIERWQYGQEQDKELLKDMALTTDGFVFTGLYIHLDENQEEIVGSDVFITKVDFEGEILWSKIYPYPEINQGVSIEQIPNGSFIVAQLNLNTDGQQAGVLKVDENGVKIWEEMYTDFGANAFSNILAMPNGNYIATGRKNDKGYILEINSSGDIVKDNVYDMGFSVQALEYANLLSDNSLVVSGTVFDDSSYKYRGVLAKFDSEYNLIWQKTLFSNPDNPDNYIYAMSAANDGGFIMSGMTIDEYPEYNNFWVIKTDSLGNDSLDLTATIEVAQNYVYIGDTLSLEGIAYGGINCYESHEWTGEGANFLEETDNVTGFFKGLVLGSYELIYTVTDSLGNMAADTVEIEVIPYTNIEEIITTEIQIYPNPSNEQFNIKLEDNNIPSLINFYTAKGQQIYSIDKPKERCEIAVSTWNKGIYFIEFVYNERQIWRKVIVN